MRRRQWSRSCSGKKRRKRKLRLDRLYSLYLFLCLFVPARKWSTSDKLLKRNGGDDETRTRDLCRDSNRLISNGVGGHLLIPQGTVGHLLSSPYCTRIVLCPLARLLSAFLTFLARGILL